MKKKILGLLAIIVLTATSCNDWFDVTSKSEIKEEDHYSTVTGFQQSLIGCYIGMTDESLYGKYLSWHLIERLGNQFQPASPSSNSYIEYRLQNYIYGSTDVISAFDNIWAKSYNVIANANEALSYIDKNRAVLDDINYHIIKGELLAIRAYMHFDILRLYGYGDWSNRASELNNKLMIPYVKTLSKTPVDRLPGKDIIKLLLDDLAEAESLLKDYDPIRGEHDPSFYSDVNLDGFFKDRTLRLNYYAVKSLEARVLLWEGSKESKAKALEISLGIVSLIENGGVLQSDMYTYMAALGTNEVNKAKSSLAIENIFGLNVSSLAISIMGYIKPSYLDTDELAMYLIPNDALNIYENNSSDVRFTQLLSQNFLSATLGYVPLKVSQDYLSLNFYKKKVSMIRIPELYYIAAECYATGESPDLDKAMHILNIMRTKRGVYNNLENLTVEQIMNEIRKEYHKEYLSEGVMFYYYKRTGATNVPFYSDIMSDKEYVLPSPEYGL